MPAVRIGRDFRLRQDILDYMAGTVRNGFIFTVDLKSRLATLFQMRNRVLREVEKRGVEAVVGGMRKLLIKGEADARARLREINDGIFRSVLFNDENGTFFGLTRIPVTVFKEGDSMTVLLQGVSPQNAKGPYHCTWHLSRAATAVYLFSYFFRGLAPNAGLLEPIEYYVEGPSIMNSSDELAHGLGNHVCSFVTQNMYMVGAKMLFGSAYREAVQAPHSRNFVQPVFAGINRRGYFAANISGTANSAGGGGRFDMDGEPALGFYWAPWADAGEVEDMDERQPHFILSRKLDKNFHGFGKYRGGTPLVEVASACGDEACAVSSWGSCDKLSFNYGLFGGYAGPPNPRVVIRGSDVYEQLRDGNDIALGQYDTLTRQEIAGDYILTSSAKNAEVFEEGDMIVHSVGAGGGYGDVLERDPEAVLQDWIEETITFDVAEKIYHGRDRHGDRGDRSRKDRKTPRRGAPQAPRQGQTVRRIHRRMAQATPAGRHSRIFTATGRNRGLRPMTSPFGACIAPTTLIRDSAFHIPARLPILKSWTGNRIHGRTAGHGPRPGRQSAKAGSG